jgi:hypothetical protein
LRTSETRDKKPGYLKALLSYEGGRRARLFFALREQHPT